MNDVAPLHGIGDNLPPDAITLLRKEIEDRSSELQRRQASLLGALDRVPASIDDEPTCGRVADFVKQITACMKALEGQRVDVKEPHLAAGRAVDGFYKTLVDPLEKAKRAVEAKITTYQRAKAEAERRRLAEEARARAEEAERQRRAAEEAAAAAATERELDTAISAEAGAEQAEADASVAAKAAEAKPAELSRSRGDYGAVASLRTVWRGDITDRDALDLEALRPHLPLDGLERAVNAFVRAGGRKLRGANIYEHATTTVR